MAVVVLMEECQVLQSSLGLTESVFPDIIKGIVINVQIAQASIESRLPYRLGLPAWAFPGWRNTYLLDRPSMLASYASVFNAVEGNTTFYHIPDADAVSAWKEATDGQEFQFCFKLPREVTHERRPDMQMLSRFLERIEPLSNNLGPFQLQFPQWAGMAHLRRLKPVFDAVADRHDAVVEVRDPELFKDPGLLEPLLDYYGFGRVMLDARALYQGDLHHPDILAAVHEKPDVPVLSTVYNRLAFVRLILHPADTDNARWIDQWAVRTVKWLSDGIVPHIMIHCPNNQYCPMFAERFHRSLMKVCDEPMPDLPAWPVPQQGSLI